ncbi:uncharacterized protein LOC131692815 isoform X1 [Topomyia yanbarensis]|uniref:uncharacterized protein LOC131692815 isoform X1 n=1 Tax=Topomyia yanbarensis TaxID=2498891 RepID=UPI00273A7844|nr:uncharacterized protein LOC131692815 isoform X1 [Topomyia yanbarensis]
MMSLSFKLENKSDFVTKTDKMLHLTAAKLRLNSIGYNNTKEIINAWAGCYSLRRYEIISGNFKLDDYSVLRNFNGVNELIFRDFRTINKNFNDLQSKLPTFLKKFKSVFNDYRSLVEEDKLLTDEIIVTFRETVDINDRSVFLAFYALPLILRQNFVYKGAKRTKLPLLMCRQSYITILATEATLSEKLAERRKFAIEYKTTIQPFIFAVGAINTSIESFFVAYDDILFKCQSAVEAIDLHFKIHEAFHLEYAAECEMVLKFIQIYFYGIHYDGQRDSSSVAALITDLDRL